MRTLGALVLTAAIAVPVAVSRVDLAAQAGTAAGVQDIKKVAEQYRKASIAGDTKAIMALYTDDAVEMPPNHPALKGKASIEAYYRKMMAEVKLSALNFTHVDTQASGNIGYDVGSYTQTFKPADGPEVKESGHYTVIVKRTGEGAPWRVAFAMYNSDRPMPPMGEKPKPKQAEKPKP